MTRKKIESEDKIMVRTIHVCSVDNIAEINKFIKRYSYKILMSELKFDLYYYN
jgi:hypothetical protein